MLRCVIADPTGNITALVLPPATPEERRAAVEALLRPPVEQVGFIRPELDGLEMMGGEFCGNATMALGAFLCRYAGRAAGEMRLRISGAPGLVRCRIVPAGDGYAGTVDMPLPERVERRQLPGWAQPVTLVRFPGIVHVLLSADAEGAAERLIRPWCAELGAEALGILPLRENPLSMRPLVYVPAAQSLVWESCCGSGTAAVGAAKAAASPGGVFSGSVRQPGGTMRVEAGPGRLAVAGTVTLSEIMPVRLPANARA